jgi:RNA polymerase sigma factor (TIGR02999 family)
MHAMEDANEISQLLRTWSGGDDAALDKILVLVYDDLRRRAHNHLRRERPGHTLQTTALVHEAYMKLAAHSNGSWANRSQFFAFAAKVMRNILVNHANSKRREKRGGGAVKMALSGVDLKAPELDLDLIALDEALNRLTKFDESLATLVELRYFSGLSLEETAEMLKISRATAARDWNMARAWLHRELTR